MQKYLNHVKSLANILLDAGLVKESFSLMNYVNEAFDTEQDLGKEPWVVNIEDLTIDNERFRATEWTGDYLQMTIMSLKPGEDIGLEIHNDIEQFIRIEKGTGRVLMGKQKDDLDFEKEIKNDFAIFIPAGTWHNIINDGDEELKLYSIYAEPAHSPGTIHDTKEEAEEYELEKHS